MDMSTVSQIVTVALAVLAIIWHQQRSTDKLRDRLDESDREHRAALAESDRGHRAGLAESDRGHRAGLDEVKHRLSRIEGFLGIGMPPAAVSEAPGTALAPQPPEPE